MLNKITNKPVWYKIWSFSVLLCAVYFLIRLCFFEPTPTDRFLEAFALGSLVLDFLIFPKEINKQA